jgi:enterochelin esterase-like enzyme
MISPRTKRNSFWIILIVLVCIIGLIIWGLFSFGSSFLQSSNNAIQKITSLQLPTDPNKSHIEKFEIPFGKTSRKVRVYLPKDYETNKVETYPTLYLLHGKGGDETDWLDQGDAQKTLDQAIEDGTIPPLIVVFPDGNGSKTHHTQYINAADGSELNEDLIYKDLVQQIDQKYRTKDDANFRAIGGNSAGGFGALNIGLKHQDVFGEIMSFSGYGHLLTYSSPSLIQGSEEVVNSNSPLTYISKLKAHTTTVWMTIGEDDSSAFIEDNMQLKKSLTKANIENEGTIIDGAHDWNFWTKHLPDGLQWLGQKWKSKQDLVQ